MSERIKALEELKRYYAEKLAEDWQDGTTFDCAVYDAIDNLIDEQRKQVRVYVTPVQVTNYLFKKGKK